MKSLFAIATASFLVLGAFASSAFACSSTDKVTASTPISTSTSTSTNQTPVDEG